MTDQSKPDRQDGDGEHTAFWRPDAAGYTMHEAAAGVYEFTDAYERTEHCGPEKKIGFIVASTQPEKR